MEENRQPLTKMAIEKHIQLLRSKNVGEDVLALVRSDLEDGLTEEETALYVNKNYNIGQMRVLSECIHKGISEEMIILLRDSRLSGHQMQVSLEFYEKGVPFETIKEVVTRGDLPVVMRRAYDAVLEKMSQTKEAAAAEPGYIKDLIAQIEEVVSKIHHQDERYDALNRKLAVFETSKEEEEIKSRLIKENEEKDATICHQQDELNRASSTIARLRNDITKKDKEMERMRDRIESLEDKMMGSGSEHGKEPEKQMQKDVTVAESQETADQAKEARVLEPGNAMGQTVIPVYYQVPIVDGSGNVLQRLPMERTVRKNSAGGMAALLGKLCIRKKSRADIVKLVASGNLVPAQLVQIRSAIEKGLTEGQLVELINNNVSAEKMKEIIEIAVLENSMAD